MQRRGTWKGSKEERNEGRKGGEAHYCKRKAELEPLVALLPEVKKRSARKREAKVRRP